MTAFIIRILRSFAFVEREIQRLMAMEYARGRSTALIEQRTPIQPVVGEPRVFARQRVEDAHRRDGCKLCVAGGR